MSHPSAAMQLAIDAARAVRGRTSPNPWVGAAVVRDGTILSVAATGAYGSAHAEAAAVADVEVKGATLYTTLEPCMPFEGKKTRPCVAVIAEAGIAKVVVGIEDPHAPVRGAGIEYLRGQGIEVEVGDGTAAITELLRPYLKLRQTGKPYVIAKFAVSLDGKVGAPSEGIRWLTSEAAVERTHQDRDWVDAIMVGSGTVLADDPELTARPGGVEVKRQPVRVLLDGRGRTPATAKALGPGALVATARGDSAWRTSVTATGAGLLELEEASEGLNLDQLLRILGQRNVMSLIAEGGPTLLASLFASGHVDEVHAYVAPLLLGDAGIPLFPGGGEFDPARLLDVAIEALDPDVLIRGYTGTWSPSRA